MFPFRGTNSVGSNVKVEDDKESEENFTGTRSDEVSSTNDEFENVQCFEYNYDLDNIDPSLFCPDIILELGDTPIFINNEQPDSNQNTQKDPLSNFSEAEKKNVKLGAVSSTVKYDLITKENEVRKKSFGPANRVQYTKIHCTACYDHLGSALSDSDSRFVHPLLKVLICKECYEFYTSGEFETEEDGSEIYCRWCGQGGQVVCCSTCQFVFCTDCIETNLGRKKLAEIKGNDDWVCFSCDPSQIIELRGHCAELVEYTQKEISRIRMLANAQSLMKIDYSNCCPSSDIVKVEKKKRKPKNPVDPTYAPYNNQNRLRKRPSTNKISSEANQLTSVPKAIAPKETSSTNMGNGSQNGTASVGFNKTFSFPPSSSKIYLAPPTLPEMKTLPDGQKIILTQNKTPQMPRSVPTINVFQNTNAGQEDLRHKKLFYQTTIRSVSNANSDFYRKLLLLKESKGAAMDGLESMVVAHNKLHDVLNRSIHSLTQVQKKLAECKPETSNAKKSIPVEAFENLTHENDGNDNKIVDPLKHRQKI